MFRKSCFVLLVMMLMVSGNVHSASIYMTEEGLEKRSLLGMVEDSKLVVSGRVLHIDGNWRNDIGYDGSQFITTDVVVQVDSVVKGEPNYEDGTCVRFMILGGTATHPETGQLRSLKVRELYRIVPRGRCE